MEGLGRILGDLLDENVCISLRVFLTLLLLVPFMAASRLSEEFVAELFRRPTSARHPAPKDNGMSWGSRLKFCVYRLRSKATGEGTGKGGS
jgi:hypothetical protein